MMKRIYMQPTAKVISMVQSTHLCGSIRTGRGLEGDEEESGGYSQGGIGTGPAPTREFIWDDNYDDE